MAYPKGTGSEDKVFCTVVMASTMKICKRAGKGCQESQLPKKNLSHTIHGTGIFTYIWLIFYGKNAGNYMEIYIFWGIQDAENHGGNQ